MMVTGNPLLMGASGKLKNIVMKQYEGKTVVTAVPDMRCAYRKSDCTHSKLVFACGNWIIALDIMSFSMGKMSLPVSC